MAPRLLVTSQLRHLAAFKKMLYNPLDGTTCAGQLRHLAAFEEMLYTPLDGATCAGQLRHLAAFEKMHHTPLDGAACICWSWSALPSCCIYVPETNIISLRNCC